MFKIAFKIMLVVLFAKGALASSAQDFFESIERHRSALEERVLFEKDGDREGSLSPSDYEALRAIADHQANVWPDTILEGDYISSYVTELVAVIGLYHERKLLAYQITYAQDAWYTGSCDYDYENEETLEECTPGSIVETSLVSADFKHYDIDQDSYAEFID